MKALLVVAFAGCYHAPEPGCGFACGPEGACPADYTCTADHVCRRNGFSGDCASTEAPDAPAGPSAFVHVVGVDPKNGATGVGVTKRITVQLDRAVLGVDSSTFYLQLGTTDVAAMADSVESFLELTPVYQLAPMTTYEIMIGAGITGVTGGVLPPRAWSFTTGADDVAPHLVRSLPFTNETGVPTTTAIALDFDEVVTGVDGTSVVVSGAASSVTGTFTHTTYSWTFTPDAPLAAQTGYTVFLTSSIHDGHGNALDATSFSFTTQ